MKLSWLKGPYSWIGSLPEHAGKPNKIFKQLSRSPRARPVVELANCLLEIGGKSVCVLFVEAPTSEIFLKHGEVMPFKKVQLKVGEPGQCHENCSRLWHRNRSGYQIATGYALTNDDGIWRRHSWLLNKHTLIETTSRRDRYFGIVLDDEQAAAFHRAYGEYD